MDKGAAYMRCFIWSFVLSRDSDSDVYSFRVGHQNPPDKLAESWGCWLDTDHKLHSCRAAGYFMCCRDAAFNA